MKIAGAETGMNHLDRMLPSRAIEQYCPAPGACERSILCSARKRAVVIYPIWITFGVAALVASSSAQAIAIEVMFGTYGQNCGAQRGNATADLATRCDGRDGRDTCEYRIDRRRILDPAAGCPKDLLAEWRCGKTEFHTAMLSPEAGAGSTLVLSCVRQTGAGK
jgi:hypothetical protein